MEYCEIYDVDPTLWRPLSFPDAQHNPSRYIRGYPHVGMDEINEKEPGEG